MGKQRKHRDNIVEGTVTVIEKEEKEMAEKTQDQAAEETKEMQAQETPDSNAQAPKKKGFLDKIGGGVKYIVDKTPKPVKVLAVGALTVGIGYLAYSILGNNGSDSDDPVCEPPMLEDNDEPENDVIDVPFQTLEEEKVEE